jgi:hypothetical protein
MATNLPSNFSNTPWGRADEHRELAPGIVWITTPSHGGYWLSDDRQAQMPEQYRAVRPFAGKGWYEEDCDWCLVALSFPEHFTDKEQSAAVETLKWIQAHTVRAN